MLSSQSQFKLLVKLQALAVSAPVTRCIKNIPFSELKREVLWNANDRVKNFYVVVRHYTNDHYGMHVGLAAPIEKLQNGEKHLYRLLAATQDKEYLGIHVINPAVLKNGPIALTVSRDNINAEQVVQPDDCVLVHTIKATDMQTSASVDITEQSSAFHVNLCFLFMTASTLLRG